MDVEAESSEIDWYRSLSPGQVSFLQLLYFFPRNYEFHKDEVIQLWIALDVVPLPPSADMEFCARSYFKEFEEHGVFQLCTFDYSAGQQRYKLSNSFVDLLAQNRTDEFFRIDDGNSHISENTKHALLRDDSLYETILEELYKAERLATLLILHQRGTHLDQLPHDLFLNLPLLRVLDLSHTSLTELPSFIGNLNDLKYLNLSYTPITALPKSLCTLYQMQTLKLKGCLKLLGLPKGMRKLINLRHLEVDLDCLLVSMPLGIGDLVELRTLPAFVVGKENGCHITELRNMKNLCGTLSILRLQNVSSSVEAKESALDNKRYLHTVELHWTYCVDGLEVLENLQPHTQLEELQIGGYGGAKFPTWIGEPIFSKLATITICDCRNSESLPPVGKLPSLQRLSISDMHAVKNINSSFCGKNMVSGLSGFKTLTLKHLRPDDHDMFKAFQSLEKLTLNRMPMLETWSGIEEGDFPSLLKLNISHCPKLTSLPELSLLISLKQLEISLCPLLESFPNKGLPTSLQCLVIIDCPRLKALSGRRDWGELGHIPYIWIDYHQIQANPSSTAVNSPLPSQNLESTVQVPLDTNVEKGKRAGLDSLTMIESHGSSEKRQANPSSTAVNFPLPSQNLESTVQVPLDTNVEKVKGAGLDSLTMVESHGSFEKRQQGDELLLQIFPDHVDPWLTLGLDPPMNSPGSKASLDPQGEEKKVVRRKIERQRRQKMSNLCTSLISQLPAEYVKGKRSILDRMGEATYYIQDLKKRNQQLIDRRDSLKKLSNSSTSITDTVLQGVCVTVERCWCGMEIVVSSGLRAELVVPLSRVLRVLQEEGLSAVNCVSSKVNQRLMHTIQAEVEDGAAYDDISSLQHKLMNAVLSAS